MQQCRTWRPSRTSNVASRTAPEFAPALVAVETLAEGSCILRSPMALEPYADHTCTWLLEWAQQAPERTFLAERLDDGDWNRICYGEALESVRCIAQSLLDRGVSAARPVMLLSENSIANALLQMAAMFIGVATFTPGVAHMSIFLPEPSLASGLVAGLVCIAVLRRRAGKA